MKLLPISTKLVLLTALASAAANDPSDGECRRSTQAYQQQSGGNVTMPALQAPQTAPRVAKRSPDP
jgi:hypothetical protein